MRTAPMTCFVFVLCLTALVPACADKTGTKESAVPSQPVSREATDGKLKKCIGQTAKDVVQLLGLKDAKWEWVDEPPGILRGVTYSSDKTHSVTIYIAEGETLFRKFDEKRKWDYAAFLSCRIGGIQYTSGELHLDIGPSVPFQWRQN